MLHLQPFPDCSAHLQNSIDSLLGIKRPVKKQFLAGFFCFIVIFVSEMRRYIIPITILLVCISCNKAPEPGEPNPERELSVPEKVEKDLAGILSKDWQDLSDTLSYFNSTMLSKGRLKGVAPDSVYYELNLSLKPKIGLEATFKVEDSTFVTVRGQIIPLSLNLSAFDMEIGINRVSPDSLALTASKVKVIAPNLFLLSKKLQAPLYYDGSPVGFLTREEFENTDYSTGVYLVAHYYDDPRTFALIDNGLADLLKMSIKDVGE